MAVALPSASRLAPCQAATHDCPELLRTVAALERTHCRARSQPTRAVNETEQDDAVQAPIPTSPSLIMDCLAIQTYLRTVIRFCSIGPDHRARTVQRAVGLKNVTYNEPFFRGHFPERPVMPGVLILEAMAQVAGCWRSIRWRAWRPHPTVHRH